jgi:hypothetical protein
MGLFGNGLPAAAALRGRILELLGAEAEWTEGDRDSAEIRWMSGPVTTFFCVEPGAEATPDLGVLRVVTPVATVGDMAFALEQCDMLNLYTTTNRWTLTPARFDGEDTEVLQVSCAFVVGPHNQQALEGFALWCVREQVAAATAKMTGDIAELLGGKPCLFSDPEGGPHRIADEWHEVVYHYDRVVTPNRDLPGEALAGELKLALRAILAEMREEESATWSSADADDSSPFFTCEMPFGWERDGTPTAAVETLYGAHPHIGNGVLITMSLPVPLPVRAGGRVPDDLSQDPFGLVNLLNLADAEVSGATHSLGGWTVRAEPTYVIYLPAVLATQGIGFPAVMREILLTLARQALLARRLLLRQDDLKEEDQNATIGLRSATAPHGLAWGETGEGRNLGARVLGRIYETCVGGDADWAAPRPDGFTWWPYRQVQEITATPYDGQDPNPGTGIRIATGVRRNVPVTPKTLTAVAELNAGLTQSALVLGDDGSLTLACRVFIHEGTEHWAARWAAILAAEQFIVARDLGDRLTGMGEDAESGHPVSGLRPEPDELFSLRENYLIPAASKVRAGLSPWVPRLALVGQYALPCRLSEDEEGSLDFSWRTSQTHTPATADPEIRVEIRRGEVGSGPGWLVRSLVLLTGQLADKARWCNDRNAAMLATPDGADHTVVGGWGLTAAGEGCLATWLSPHFMPDTLPNATGLVGNLLRYSQGTIIKALSDDPGPVADQPLTPRELADGLSSVIGTFGEFLDSPDDYSARTRFRDEGAIVMLSGRSKDDEPFAEMTAADDADTGDDDSSDVESAEIPDAPYRFRTVLAVPVGYNRTELSLLYAALLGQSQDRPGEASYETPNRREAAIMLRELESEGIIEWDEERQWVFDAGAGKARFEIEPVKFGRNPVESALWMYDPYALRIAGYIDQPDVQIREVTDPYLIGSWAWRRPGTAYQVIIPPIESLWVGEYMAVEMLTWIGRHIVKRVQEAV